MPLTLRWGTVTAVNDRGETLIRCEVDSAPCVAYPRVTGGVEEGDVVIVNSQARELELGSGGFDVVHVNLTRGLGLVASEGAHVMSLPYTSAQHVGRFVEEGGPSADALDGMPVVCCGLHSQVAPAVVGLGPELRVAYAQVGGGALPVSLSDTVRELRRRGLIETAIAVAPCHDGDMQAVTVASALTWAKASGFDVVVCSIGPGIVGTGSAFGHGGLAVADVANTSYALGGRTIIAPRISLADERPRHLGVSHHTLAVLRLCHGEPFVAWPAGLEGAEALGSVFSVDVDGWRVACAGVPLDHMGRGPDEDPWFFASAYAAGRLAARQL
jgi:Protein of unknown function (DUF3866)